MTQNHTTHEVARMMRDVETIMTTSAEFFGVPLEHMISRKRHEPLATQRQVVMALCEQLTQASQTDIAKAFARGSHGTVTWAIQAAKDKIETTPKLKEQADELRQRCKDAIAAQSPA